MEMKKEHLNVLQLWNMSFGFLGIQFGWGLQMTNMSAIFEYLGAQAHEIPILWIAAPCTGLIVQPIIGNMSDRTWGPLGRRRPYLLVGAILASIALILMPHVIRTVDGGGIALDFRHVRQYQYGAISSVCGRFAPDEQRTQGFAMQSFYWDRFCLRSGISLDFASCLWCP
jgi:maltose/moltooligosaccharide transporter